VWIAVPSAAYELLAMWTWHMIVMSAYAVASYRERHRWCPSGSQCPVSVSSHEALNVPVYPECGSALESPPDDQRVPIARISGSANVAP
jgi:hypothetical protein